MLRVVMLKRTPFLRRARQEIIHPRPPGGCLTTSEVLGGKMSQWAEDISIYYLIDIALLRKYLC